MNTNNNKFVLNNHDIYACIKALRALSTTQTRDITRERIHNVFANPSSGNALFILKAQIHDNARYGRDRHAK